MCEIEIQNQTIKQYCIYYDISSFTKHIKNNDFDLKRQDYIVVVTKENISIERNVL